MYRHLIYSLILLCCGNWSHGQENVFAYGRSKWSKYQPQEVTGYKLETATAVYQKLLDAKANWGMFPPDLVMNSGKSLIAWMDASKHEIGLEEKAYDVCASFGADSLNALATLLAHELTHYYEKHDWVRQFASTHASLSISDSLSMLNKILEQEVQADHLGGLLAFSAGYNTLGISAKFLRRAYEAYSYDENLPGYPPLSQRIAIAEDTNKELLRLQGVWQTANLLNIIAEYESGRSYYQHILQAYPSFEVFNNAGVNSFTAALRLFEEGEWPYVFPIELDSYSRLDQLKVRLPEDKEKRRKQLLAEATRLFESAEQIAKDYPPALINLACTYLLQAEWEDAEELASRARRRSMKQKLTKAQADAELVLGIIAAMQGQESDAAQWFERAKAGNASLAATNLSVLTKAGGVAPWAGMEVKGSEQISGLSMDDYLAAPMIDESIDLGQGTYLGLRRLKDSEIYYHYMEASFSVEYIVFHSTLPGYAGETVRGIALGADYEALCAKYGQASSLLQLKDGKILHYGPQGIFFELDTNNKVRRWVVYKKGAA